MHRGANLGVLTAMVVAAFVGSTMILAFPHPAQALPSFARQTGQPCGACHTDFPGLTPFGRHFKLGGYTLGGGQFRTALFPSAESSGASKSASAMASLLQNSGNATKSASNDVNPSWVTAYAAKAVKNAPVLTVQPTAPSTQNLWFPPVSMMVIIGQTHTQQPLPPPTEPWAPNDNVVVSPFSLFYGGAITEHIGTFAQVTYNAPGPGGLGPFDHTWSWDNIDLRYSNTTKVGGLDVVYGITANNNPTVQDLWNTTPAWKFPYASSTLAPTPAAGTVIDGAFSGHVAGVGGYVLINDLLYLEASAYHTLDFNTQNRLGVNPFDAPGTFDVAPYWRVAVEPHWDKHWLMIGTFGMVAPVHPWVDTSGALGDATFAQTDRYTDIGVDAQYQYQGEDWWLTLRASHIHEDQKLDATFANLGSANPTNTLETTRAYVSLAIGGDNKFVLTGQYFSTRGTPDPILFMNLISCTPPNTACSPDSKGWIAEIAYIPFGKTTAPVWPWFNARLALQYTHYDEFDGDTVHAGDNNTVFLHAWFAM